MARNKLAHGKKIDTRENIGKSISRSAQNYYSAASRRTNKRVDKDVQYSWTPPPNNWMKINYDAAPRSHGGLGAYIARDSKGIFLCLYMQLSPCDPFLRQKLQSKHLN